MKELLESVVVLEVNPEDVCDGKRLPVSVVVSVTDPEEDRVTTGLIVLAMDSDINPETVCVRERLLDSVVVPETDPEGE